MESIKQLTINEFQLSDLNFPNNFRLGMRSGLVDMLGFTEDKEHCSICTKRFLLQELVVKLGCDNFH